MSKHTIIFATIIVILLAGCNSDETPGNTGQSPASNTPPPVTAAPVLTRIVTLTPEPTLPPSPVPTLNETLLPLQGSHTLMLRYTLSGSSLVEQLIYAASATVTIDLDGQISGEGEFSPTLTQGTCLIDLEHGEALQFAVEGMVTDALMAEIRIVPQDAQANERYIISCYPDPQAAPEITTIEQPILWRILEGADLLSFNFDLHEPNSLQTIEVSVSDVTDGAMEGMLNGEIYFGR